MRAQLKGDRSDCRDGTLSAIELSPGVVRGSTPTTYAPEEESKEEQSANIDPHGIAELVVPPGVAVGIDVHVVSHCEIWQGEGHEGSLNKPHFETGALSFLVQKTAALVEGPADASSQEEKTKNAKQQSRSARPIGRSGRIAHVKGLMCQVISEVESLILHEPKPLPAGRPEPSKPTDSVGDGIDFAATLPVNHLDRNECDRQATADSSEDHGRLDFKTLHRQFALKERRQVHQPETALRIRQRNL